MESRQDNKKTPPSLPNTATAGRDLSEEGSLSHYFPLLKAESDECSQYARRNAS